MLIKGNDPENIKFGSTLATDEFSNLRFDFMLSNPPYGKSWKTDQGQILEKKGSKTEIIDPRFEVQLPDAQGQTQLVSAAPAVDDGQLLFLMEMVSKMKSLQDAPLGSRIATVHNGSALFTGNAGGGASNIRQYLIENDLLEAIIQLPNNIFYNTGITTYIWVLSNHKAEARRDKVQLIDASQLFEKLRKNLGEKNCAFTPDHIAQITRAYLDLADTGKEAVDGLKAQVFDNRDFGYWKITVERPLRKSAQFTAERIESLRFDKRLAEEMQWMFEQWGEQVYEPGFLSAKEQKDALDDWLEEEEIDRKAADKKKLLDPKFWTGKRELLQAAEQLHQHLGEDLSHDFSQFQKDVKTANKKLKLKLSAPQLKAILEAVSWRDSGAEPIGGIETLFELDINTSPEDLRPWYSAIENGTGITYEPDSELRDTENVPLNYEGGIEAYFKNEVLPHVPDISRSLLEVYSQDPNLFNLHDKSVFDGFHLDRPVGAASDLFDLERDLSEHLGIPRGNGLGQLQSIVESRPTFHVLASIAQDSTFRDLAKKVARKRPITFETLFKVLRNKESDVLDEEINQLIYEGGARGSVMERTADGTLMDPKWCRYEIQQYADIKEKIAALSERVDNWMNQRLAGIEAALWQSEHLNLHIWEDRLLDIISFRPYQEHAGKIYHLTDLSDGEYAQIQLLFNLAPMIMPEHACWYHLDDIDDYLHPEWKRNLIQRIATTHGEITSRVAKATRKKVYAEKVTTCIVATHSPFVLSDLPRECVLRFTKDSNGKTTIKRSDESTFAGNIGELFHTEFFMDTTIGEFARQAIKKTLKVLENNPDSEAIESARHLFENVGDEVLRNLLLEKVKNAED